MKEGIISFIILFGILIILVLSLIPIYNTQPSLYINTKNTQPSLYINTTNYAGITVYNNGLNPQFISASADFQIPHISLPPNYNLNNSYSVSFWVGLTDYNGIENINSSFSKRYILQAGIDYQYSLLNKGNWITTLWYEIYPYNETVVSSIISNSSMGNTFNIRVSIINAVAVYFSITDLNDSLNPFYNWCGIVFYTLFNQPEGITYSPEVLYIMETPKINGTISYLPHLTKTFITNIFVKEYNVEQFYGDISFYNMYKNNNLAVYSFFESSNPLIIELNPVTN